MDYLILPLELKTFPQIKNFKLKFSLKTALRYIFDTMSRFLYIFLIFSVFIGYLNATSLWLKSSNSQRGMYGGKRAFAVGDLVTIDVAESSSLTASQNSARNRELEVESAVTQFLYAQSGFGKHKGDLPRTQIESETSNEGGGSIANTQDLKGRVSVIVIDVLPVITGGISSSSFTFTSIEIEEVNPFTSVTIISKL